LRGGEVDGDFITDEFIFGGAKESTVLVIHAEVLAIEGAAKGPALVSIAGEGDGKFHGLGDARFVNAESEFGGGKQSVVRLRGHRTGPLDVVGGQRIVGAGRKGGDQPGAGEEGGEQREDTFYEKIISGKK